MTSSQHGRRLVASALGLGLALSSLALAPGSASAADDPKNRRTTAPEVAFPLPGTKKVVDKRNYTQNRGFTDISAPCGSTVRSAVPGTATVLTRTMGRSKRYVVRVQTATPGLWVGNAYLSRTSVRTGDVITSGKALGTLGARPGARSCVLQFKVKTATGTVNPSSWLARNVGTPLDPPPVVAPAPGPDVPNDAPGFTVASFNILGAKHTTKHPVYATYPSRFRRAMKLLDDRGVDVAGLQEMHREQADFFRSQGYDRTWGIFHYDPPGPAQDTDNAIIYRKSSMELVSGHTFPIPYFFGKDRAMPALRLREKASGKTAWFLNVHNPASSKKRGDHSGHRARAVELERQKVANLRASTGDPVFLTGDFNDNEAAYCPLTSDGLMVTPNSPPGPTDGTCRMIPGFWSIDWIFAAGDVAFTSFARDMWAKEQRINDHPVILTTVLLG